MHVPIIHITALALVCIYMYGVQLRKMNAMCDTTLGPPQKRKSLEHCLENQEGCPH